VNALKQRYLFAALFSSGVTIQMGFELGSSNHLHVVRTRPEDWQSPPVDLTGSITQINRIKTDHALLREEPLIAQLYHPDPCVLMF
jgi:starch synthase (maltosyl-transferring)